jgi:hypothetical protein
MATPAKPESKSAFIEQLLRQDPHATFKAVNEAWAASGHEGTISQALVNKMRSEAGLSGNLRTKEKQQTRASSEGEAPAPVGKKRRRKPKARARDQGKTPFVKEFLADHPEGSVQDVNAAWRAAGLHGTISPTLVYQMRKQLGLTGDRTETAPREKAAPTGKRRGRKPKATTPATDGKAGGESRRTPALEDLEADIDRLLFKIMEIGDLPQVEEGLRQTRRLLYGTFNRS